MPTLHWLLPAAVLLAGCRAATESPVATASEPTPAATARAPEAGDEVSFHIPWPGEDEAFTNARANMVAHQIARRGVQDADVLRAMATVPRHEFTPDEYLAQAYADHPLPIGYGQTISQPYIVALMTELLALQGDERVLEIGTGSGYQAAVLAQLLPQVFTIEIVPELAERAAARLQRLGYDNVQVLSADGYFGWEEHAPFDAIIVTAAPDQLPPPLVAQLAPGGRLVIPIGPQGGAQVLWQFVKEDGDELTGYRILDVRFVPFTRATDSAPR
ncbi:MAG: protein-L-isoaspartate(D-aspartate) O-methyltransferase [Anaerolineales bacterium]